MRLLVALVALAACGGETAQPEDLSAYLRHASDVAGWKLDEAAWRRIVVEPYRGLYADYAREFERAVPELVRQLTAGGPIADREHFAGDPELTQDQAVARWAVPPLFPSRVATVGGAPLDAVMLRDGGRWRAIVGLGAVVRAKVEAIDARCAALFAVERPHRDLVKTCRDTTWAIADAALRDDRDRTLRACKLADTVCGKRSPP